MSAQHTPGPWDVDMGEVYAVRDSDGGRIAIMTNLRGRHGMGGRRDGSEVAANTLLTAASPDLLQMLHECAEYIAALNGEQDDYCQRARALIARATGEVK